MKMMKKLLMSLVIVLTIAGITSPLTIGSIFYPIQTFDGGFGRGDD